jgi:drug/metabolite transporter (DMT)-like permease
MLAIVMLFWAGNSIVGRAVTGDIPPLTLAFLRWSIALLILVLVAANDVRRDWPALLLAWRPTLILGLLGVGAFNALLYSGLAFTSASNALLIQAAIPTLVLLLDWLLFKDRPQLAQCLGTSISILGVAVVVLRGDLSSILMVQVGKGDALVLCAVVAWSLYTVGLRLRPEVSGKSFLAATFAVGVVSMAPLAAWENWRGLDIHWSRGTVAAIAYVSVLPSLVAYMLFNNATAVVGPARAGHAIALMPLFGALLASTILGEPLLGYHWTGMGLIVMGMFLGAVRSTSSRRRAAG